MAVRLDYTKYKSWIDELNNQHFGPFTTAQFSGAISKFEVFCKLLHPIFEDLSVVDRKQSWDEFDRTDEYQEKKKKKLEKTNPEMARILSEGRLVRGSPDAPFPAKRITWRELAFRYGLNYDENIDADTLDGFFPNKSWPRYLVAPEEGVLEEKQLKVLYSIISDSVASKECIFFSEPWLTRATGPFVLLGSLNDLRDYQKFTQYPYPPNLWWSEKELWFVSSHCDSTYTVVGGMKDIVERILKNNNFEALQVWPKK